MSEFGGLWMEQQNNPACTKSVKVLQRVEVGHYTEEEECWCTELRESIHTTLADETSTQH